MIIGEAVGEWVALSQSASFLKVPASTVCPVFHASSHRVDHRTHVSKFVASCRVLLLAWDSECSAFVLHDQADRLECLLVRSYIATIVPRREFLASAECAPRVADQVVSAMEG